MTLGSTDAEVPPENTSGFGLYKPGPRNLDLGYLTPCFVLIRFSGVEQANLTSTSSSFCN